MSRLGESILTGGLRGAELAQRAQFRREEAEEARLLAAIRLAAQELQGRGHDIAERRLALDTLKFGDQLAREVEGRRALAALAAEIDFGLGGMGLRGDDLYADAGAGDEVYGPPLPPAGADAELYGPPLPDAEISADAGDAPLALPASALYGAEGPGAGGAPGGLAGVIGSMPTALSRPIVQSAIQQQLVLARLRASNMEKIARKLEGIDMLPIEEERKAILRSSVLAGLGEGTMLRVFPELGGAQFDPDFFAALQAGEPWAAAEFFNRTGRYVGPPRSGQGASPEVLQARAKEFDAMLAQLPAGEINTGLLPVLRQDYLTRGQISPSLWTRALGERGRDGFERWLAQQSVRAAQANVRAMVTAYNRAMADDPGMDAAEHTRWQDRIIAAQNQLRQATEAARQAVGGSRAGAAAGPDRTASPPPATGEKPPEGTEADAFTKAWDAFVAKYKRDPDPDNPQDRALFAELLGGGG